ncbi:RNase P subunit p30-domain-containing protein [Cunninghamella echinulata]|nr:RNase P subunit p30-domain-containing protein [Cunninghamella echinulata]
MYFDFNLLPSTNKDQINNETVEAILTRLKTLSPATIAWNSILEDINQFKPTNMSRSNISTDQITQLSRLTIKVDNPKKNYQLTTNNVMNQKIDLLAVQPLTLDACKQSCQVYEIDLISLDLSNQSITPGYVAAQVAVTRGIFFEICYTQSYLDPSLRSSFISNVGKLINQTRGHNLIFSSGALNALHIKRVSDIKILALMFGMTQLQAEAATGSNYTRLLRRAETRKNTILAAISVNKPISTTNTPMELDDDGNDKNQNQNSNQNKRKNDETNDLNQKKKKKKKQKKDPSSSS